MSEAVDDELESGSEAARLIRSRRTIHDFTTERVPQEKILAAVELARWAPNHHATEPWHFYLLGPQTAAEIARLNASLVERKSGAEAAEQKLARWSAMPGWLVVTCERSEDARRWQEDYAACCCAIQNMMLYLWGEGIGVKWTTGAVTREPDFYDLIWVDPEVEAVVGLLWYGYAEHVPQVRRKAVDEIVVSLP